MNLVLLILLDFAFAENRSRGDLSVVVRALVDLTTNYFILKDLDDPWEVTSPVQLSESITLSLKELIFMQTSKYL
jgi:hypothetical protein